MHHPPFVVIGLCRNQPQAALALDELRQHGFSRDRISALFPDKTATKEFPSEGIETRGAPMGGAFAWLLGASAVDLRGLGPFIAAGPFVAVLHGVMANGGLAGGLLKLGFPQDRAERYENRLRVGGIFISVDCENAEELERGPEFFKLAGATEISVIGQGPTLSAAA